MAEPPESAQGTLANWQRLLRTVLRTALNRLELLLVEVQEERVHVVALVLLVLAVVGFGLMALLMASLTVVVLFWENHRFLALLSLCGLYLLAAGGAYCLLQRQLKNWQIFSATIAEIQKDKACLEKKS